MIDMIHLANALFTIIALPFLRCVLFADIGLRMSTPIAKHQRTSFMLMDSVFVWMCFSIFSQVKFVSPRMCFPVNSQMVFMQHPILSPFLSQFFTVRDAIAIPCLPDLFLSRLFISTIGFNIVVPMLGTRGRPTFFTHGIQSTFPHCMGMKVVSSCGKELLTSRTLLHAFSGWFWGMLECVSLFLTLDTTRINRSFAGVGKVEMVRGCGLPCFTPCTLLFWGILGYSVHTGEVTFFRHSGGCYKHRVGSTFIPHSTIHPPVTQRYGLFSCLKTGRAYSHTKEKRER